jgi:hypothetical protein
MGQKYEFLTKIFVTSKMDFYRGFDRISFVSDLFMKVLANIIFVNVSFYKISNVISKI